MGFYLSVKRFNFANGPIKIAEKTIKTLSRNYEGMNHISNVNVHLKTRSGNVNIRFYFILSSEINAYQKQIKVIPITSD